MDGKGVRETADEFKIIGEDGCKCGNDECKGKCDRIEPKDIEDKIDKVSELFTKFKDKDLKNRDPLESLGDMVSILRAMKDISQTADTLSKAVEGRPTLNHTIMVTQYMDACRCIMECTERLMKFNLDFDEGDPEKIHQIRNLESQLDSMLCDLSILISKIVTLLTLHLCDLFEPESDEGGDKSE